MNKYLFLVLSFLIPYLGFSQLPIDCNLFYTHNSDNSITNYNPILLTSSLNSISAPGGGLAVSKNLNTALPATTFYTIISGFYHYYNGSVWVNTGHGCTSSTAVNIGGAGPYIYNLDGGASKVYRYNGTGTDVLVLTLPSWGGPYDVIGDDYGNFYILFTISGNQKLVKYSPFGVVLCTYTLFGMPASTNGGGYAIVNNKLYANTGAGNFVGTISGTTISFVTTTLITGLPSDFASCPFPQLNSGITSTGNLTCSVLTSALTATTSVTGPTFSWSGPGIVSGGSTSSAIVNAPGVYTVVVTGSGGACPGSATSTISISSTGAGQIATASSGGTLTCTTTNVVLSGGPAGMTSYNWTGPGIVSGGSSANPTVNATGNYILTIVNSSGCTSTVSVNVPQNNTPPVSSASSSGSITCVSSSVLLSGGPSSGVNYNWSGPSFSSGTTSQNATATSAGTYTLLVTNTINGCTSISTTNVSNNTALPLSTASSAGSVTCVSTTINLSSSPSGMNYVWTAPGGSSISSGSTSQSAIGSGSGIYTVNITDPLNGCSKTATVNAPQNTTLPISAAATSGSITCVTNSVSLSSSPSGMTYVWSAPGGSSISSGSNSQNAIGSGSGVYTVNITDPINGCSKTATVIANQNLVIPVSSASTSGTITCATTTINLASTPSGLNYLWIASGGSSISSGSTSQNAIGNGQGTYTVTVTDPINGCSSSSAVSSINNNSLPVTSASATGSITCTTNTVNLSSTLGGMSYTWIPPVGSTIISGVNSQTAIGQGAGVYSITVLNSSTGCSVIATATVLSNSALPTLSVTSTSTLITCLSPTIGLTASSSNTNTISWITPTGTSTNPVTAFVAGNYIVSITDAISGCTSTQTISVIGTTVAPTAIVAASSIMPCGTSTLVMAATSSQTSGVTYLWTGPNVVSGSASQNPTIGMTGLYTVVVTDTLTSCSSSATVSVNQGSISAAFSADPLSGIPPLSVNFTDLSLGAIGYSWDFGNGTVSTIQNPNTIYPNTGTFNVMLIITSGTCSDTAYTTIIVNDGFSLEIPNVFTPNNDGINDLFTIKSTGVKEISMQIFNRWGEKMFEFTGPKAAWDGINSNGAKVSDGTYFYFVKATGFDHKEFEKNGTVNLFR